MNDGAQPKAVQACITNVSFPQTLDDLKRMLLKNEHFGRDMTDLQALLEHKPGEVHAWTAPIWMSAGDILFFYHAVSAVARIRRLRKQVEGERPADRQRLLRVLERAAAYAERYAGTLIGCTEVLDQPNYEPLPEEERHFQSRIFAPFDRVALFRNRLSPQVFKTIVSISRQSALTPIDGKQFEDLRARLLPDPGCPDYLKRAVIGGQSFRDVNASTWRAISCHPAARFIYENQLRRYLIDYLLQEIRDPQSQVLEECACARPGYTAGRADYMVQVGGRWVPIEAKLNVLAEPNLSGQLQQYLQIDGFTPTVGKRREQRIPTVRQSACLVIDQEYLYLYRGHQAKQRALQQLLTRAEIGQIPAETIRARVLAALESTVT